MKNQTGLKDPESFEAFSRQWRDVALREAEKWCAGEKAVRLLADAVLLEFQKKYADSAPPLSMEYQIRAQVCLVYSLTGENVRKLENYIAEHALPEPPEEPAAKARPEPESRPPAHPPEDAPAAPAEAPAPDTPAEAPVPAAPTEVPAPAPAAPETPTAQSAKAPAPADKAAEKPSKVRPDTFLDPVRTTFWTPSSEINEHVVAEIELPDEEEVERSVVISFINLLLFLLTAGSFAFCVYETGFLQYLLQ